MADMNEIDRKIAEAKAKQAKQGKTTQVNDQVESTRKRRPRLTAEERAERDAAKDAEKAERKKEREAKRAAKLAEREANKKPAHMVKIQKVLDALPELSGPAEERFAEATASLSLTDLENLSAHLSGHVRVERTKQALSRTVEEGQTVRIVGGPAKFIGKVGTVNRAQRIRCYVQVPGHDKEVYLFISDTEDVTEGTLVTETEDVQDAAAEA